LGVTVTGVAFAEDVLSALDGVEWWCDSGTPRISDSFNSGNINLSVTCAFHSWLLPFEIITGDDTGDDMGVVST
jgi:hypothetical protein